MMRPACPTAAHSSHLEEIGICRSRHPTALDSTGLPISPPVTVIYTDGACIGTAPMRPGGWAAVVLADEVEEVVVGSHRSTTIGRMELTAAVHALRAVPVGSRIVLYTDSAPLVAGMTGRLAGWRLRGWRTTKGRKVADRDLWELLAELAATRHVTWTWLKGHSGDAGNERADALARAQAWAAARSA
jgi:ribonuclease HI